MVFLQNCVNVSQSSWNQIDPDYAHSFRVFHYFVSLLVWPENHASQDSEFAGYDVDSKNVMWVIN